MNASGSVTNIDLNGDGKIEYSIPLALSKQSYKVAGLISGQAYRLTIIDYDVAAMKGIMNIFISLPIDLRRLTLIGRPNLYMKEI